MDHKTFGETLRRIRKEKGLRLKDLEDENISASTISSIERGVPTVKQVYRDYYVSKLSIQVKDIPDILEKKQRDQDELKNDLLLLEARIELDSNPLEWLRRLKKQDAFQDKEMFYYLRGRCHIERNNLNTAKKMLLKAIEIINEKKSEDTGNIRACCFKDLSRISYWQGNMKQSLQYVEEGLKCINPDGERSKIVYFLLIGKVSYLEKLGRLNESLQVLEKLWESYDQIDNIDIKLNMYEVHANILDRKKEYNEALKYVKDGFRIAIGNQRHERAIELLNTWGRICVNSGDYRTAEECYQLALDLKDTTGKSHLIITTYTRLGELFMNQGKWEEAEYALSTAVSIGKRSLKGFSRYCHALSVLGDYYSRRKMYDRAIESYQEATTLSKNYGLYNLGVEILKKQAKCWKILKIEKNYLETLQQIELQLEQVEL